MKLHKLSRIILTISGSLAVVLLGLLIIMKIISVRQEDQIDVSSVEVTDGITDTVSSSEEPNTNSDNSIETDTDNVDSSTSGTDEQFQTPDSTDDIDAPTDEIESTPVELPPAPVNIVFTGDIELSEGVQQGYDASGLDGVLSPMMQALLTEADITFINNEFCFSTRGEKAPDKQFTFRVDPKYINILTDMSVDIATLANNHSLDYGTDALLDTFDTMDQAGITYIGAGDSLSRASELKIIEKEGLKFGFLSASRVIPVTSWDVANGKPGVFTTYDATKLNSAIKDARDQVDYLIVYVHWGIERDAYPQEYQRTLAKGYINNGADIVIGTHPHVLQGIEYYNNKPIFYSLGNFIFNSNIGSTAVLSLTVEQTDNGLSNSLKLTPGHASGYITQVDEGEKASEILSYIKSISTGVDIDEYGYVTEAIE